MSIDQMAEVFHDFLRHYTHVRMFKYENFKFAEDDFVMFSSDPSVIYGELTIREHPEVTVNAYSKEHPSYIYIDGDDYKIDVEFYRR